MHRYFALDMPAGRFLGNVFLLSLAGLLPVLALYVALTPGFAAMLSGGGIPLSRFLRQVLSNGLIVIFVVNYAGCFLFAWSIRAEGTSRDLRRALWCDLPLRLGLFITLHAAIYVLSADWFGSFGGSRLTALGVVAPTLARSAFFDNISGVYLYAVLLGAMPVWLSLGRRIWPVPGWAAPLLALCMGVGMAATLTVLAVMISGLQTA